MSSPPQFEIYITQDGSPTLQWQRADGYSEKMHHSGGALTESLFIYQEGLQNVLEREWPVNILSLGLGLAYNELITIATLHKAGCAHWKMWSFETSDFLREEFVTWVADSRPTPLDEIYNRVLAAVAAQFEISREELKSAAVQALKDGRFEMRGAFPQDAGTVYDCTCVFYDAFSKKMDPELWEENAIVASLEPRLSASCLLTTYAATGSLNRALKTLGFRLIPRPGFQGKRESTLAIRE